MSLYWSLSPRMRMRVRMRRLSARSDWLVKRRTGSKLILCWELCGFDFGKAYGELEEGLFDMLCGVFANYQGFFFWAGGRLREFLGQAAMDILAGFFCSRPGRQIMPNI